jgi:hypothetical protein
MYERLDECGNAFIVLNIYRMMRKYVAIVDVI